VTETDATLARRNEATAVMRSLHESLQEPLFMKALVCLVSANGKDEKCEIADHSRIAASATNGEG
jgi:hypothetical protein